jgi:hypothetical protein
MLPLANLIVVVMFVTVTTRYDAKKLPILSSPAQTVSLRALYLKIQRFHPLKKLRTLSQFTRKRRRVS